MKKRTWSYQGMYLISLIFATIVIALAIKEGKAQNTEWNKENFYSLNSNWTLIYNDQSTFIDLPYQFDEVSSLKYQITSTLPDKLNKYDMLVFRNNHQAVKVYINDIQVYDYSNETSKHFPIETSLWNFIELKQNDAGKRITIELSSLSKNHSSKIPSILLGEKSSILIDLIKNNLFGIVICFVMLTISLFLFLFWMISKKIFHDNSLLYLSLFALQVFLWSFMETNIIQFFIKNPTILGPFTVEALLLNGFPILLYIRENSEQRIRKVAQYLIYYAFATVVLVNTLHFSGIVPMEGSISFIHINYALTSILMMLTKVIRVRQHKTRIRFTITTYAFFLLGLTIIIDILRFYSNNITDSARYTRIGLIVYMLVLCTYTIQNTLDAVVLGHKAKVYEHLAYHDILTESKNRTALENDIYQENQALSNKDSILFMVFDLNDLKGINDTLGHDMGDQYIIANSNFIEEHFKSIGELYRTGGDEFVLFVKKYDEKSFQNCLEAMKQDMSTPNPIPKKRINFAYGYAVFDSKLDHTLHDTMKRADERMYEKKIEMKLEMKGKLT